MNKKQYRYLDESTHHGDKVKTLYANSYAEPTKFNVDAGVNAPRKYGMTKLLYQPETKDVTMKDIFLANNCQTNKHISSYTNQFRPTDTMIIADRIPLGKLNVPVAPTNEVSAMKYKEWSQ